MRKQRTQQQQPHTTGTQAVQQAPEVIDLLSDAGFYEETENIMLPGTTSTILSIRSGHNQIKVEAAIAAAPDDMISLCQTP